ncbi:heme NO-binding domain-containing protein [Thaumasiovibrio sp. DFM-14]|uniref:heme NO-binding domain-containing protein n=1 Tax=Thaumasiovibrio sp. DFM-14 TaxID=3384792 RepID=UPI00399F9714
MKGMIFTEFLELVEEKFGLEVYEEMLDNAGDSGIYTAVGSYDHTALVKLIIELSKLTGIAIEDLQEAFGTVAFKALLNSLPQQENLGDNTFEFLQTVESFIHKEVIKLYPDATPPRFEFNDITPTSMIMHYYSSRCMGHVCLGLIKGCAQHFNEKIAVEMHAVNGQQDHVQFSLALVSSNG